MPYVSSLIGKPVSDVDGVRIGTLSDLVASVQAHPSHPKIVALVARQRRGSLTVPITEAAVLIAPAIPLTRRQQDLVPYVPKGDDLFVVRDVLDKQIIDTNGVHVVRVNDLELARANGSFYIANVDVGGLGLLRRLGLAPVFEWLARRLGRPAQSNIISWEHVELLPGDQPLRLKSPSAKMAELHAADLAEILSDLSRQEGSKLLDSLDVQRVADTLEEVEPDFQASLVERMPDERVADVLEEMAPDEAADLLAELPEGRSEELLQLMQADEAKDVRKLLAYPEESAGGIMTTEFIAVPSTLTAEQVMDRLRENAEEAETIFYVYVTDEQNHLLGVFSLRDLVMAQPKALVSDFMDRRLISVKLTDKQEDCAQAVTKYDLLAVPVVDDENRIHGIVTAGDALDKIIPTAWKKRLPRIYD